MTDAELDQLLKTSQPAPNIPRDFRSEVWSRIALAEAATVKSRWHSLLLQLLAALTRPLPATATIAATILLGAWLGSASAPQPGDAKVSYAETISPFRHFDTP